MICDRKTKIDIREVIRGCGPLPRVIDFNGERIVTTSTDTAFGGTRQWFLCPSCDRRCAVIYRKADGPLWGCRICMRGRYLSELKSPHYRKVLRAQRIRKRLGQADGNLMRKFPSKPKHMHWKTYWRLRDEGKMLEHEIAMGLVNKIEKAFGENVDIRGYVLGPGDKC